MKAYLFGRLTPALEARRRLLRAVRPVERTERVAIGSAFGRVAAESLRAATAVPPFDRANWDGYAVRSVDLRAASRRHPILLRVVGEVFAEGRFPRRLRAGEAVAVATGAAMPAGADALEIFEESERHGDRLRLRRPVVPDARISPAGDDFPKGRTLATAGELLGPAAIGSLASSGVARVPVYARPIVAIVPNGNELRAPGARLRGGEIFESNTAALSAVLEAAGCHVITYAPVADDPRRIERTLAAALRKADLVIATGGSSVGERDHLPRIFPRLGRLLFHGVAVRPGKPTLAADAGGRLLLGLPGHPTSCLLNMHWMVLPALRRLARLPGPGWTEATARLQGGAAAMTPGLATVLPLRLDGERAWPTFRGSAATRSLAGANGFAVLPPGRRTVAAGARLTVYRLDPPLGAPGRG